MHKEQLRETLTELHSELASVETLDDETRQLLQQVAGDIEAVMAEAHDEPLTVQERVGEMAATFRAEHPRLSGILTQLADTLSKLGI